MYHVKALAEPPLMGLDLNIADEEEFSPDKMRANIERLYMTVIVGLVGFYKHIARLRSWRESKRTMAFGGVYFAAWAIDFLVPTIVAFIMVLIAYPPSRAYCFPPAPVALIDSKTGGVKKPTAGVLGSDDSLTGAPEKHQGEAVEQEASNFVNSFASIALSSAAGKHPQGDPHNGEEGASGLEDHSPDPTNLVHSAAAAKEKTAGGDPSPTHNKQRSQCLLPCGRKQDLSCMFLLILLMDGSVLQMLSRRLHPSLKRNHESSLLQYSHLSYLFRYLPALICSSK